MASPTLGSPLPTLDPTTESCRLLLTALQRTRSIAAENGTLELLQDPSIPGQRFDKLAHDDRTVDLLADLATGTRPLVPELWMNLTHMVNHAPSWAMSLAVQGYTMPESAVGAYTACRDRVAS